MSMAGLSIRLVSPVSHGDTSVTCFFAGVNEYENLK